MRPNTNNRRRENMQRGTVATPRHKAVPWTPPANLVEAKRRRQDITDQLLDIESKLASHNVTDNQGRRLSGREYFEFRDKLIRKKMNLVREIQLLKRYVAQAQTEDAAKLAGVTVHDNDEKLLLKAYQLFQQLKREDVDFDEPELAFLDILGKRVGLR